MNTMQNTTAQTVRNILASTLKLGILAVGLFPGAASVSHAQTAPTAAVATAPVRNVVLVHGAFANSSSWSKIIPLLEAKGLHVTAVQLSLTSLADDAATVKRALALEDGPVLLVGHSYGGMVITEAGNDPKVAGLLYVAAFAPVAGESGIDQSKPFPASPGGAEFRPDAAGFLKITHKGMLEDFAQDLPVAERDVMAATQEPVNVAAIGGKITSAAWQTKPTAFIVASQDRMIAPEQEKASAAQMHARTLVLPSSHVVMLSHPAEVARFIVETAAQTK